ncbi:MAG TPA: MazG nucleotide pyrophosphohydrolase domain-containing protein [Acidimicrobiia bacterium]
MAESGPSDRESSATVASLAEEVGELARAVRKGSRRTKVRELGDVVAWIALLANQIGISLKEATRRNCLETRR